MMRLHHLAFLLLLAGSVVAQEPTANVRLYDTGFTELDEGRGNGGIHIDLVTPLTSTVNITVASVGGTATPGEDYVPLSEVVQFLPGETRKVVRLVSFGDIVDEDHETVIIRATQNGVTRATATITLVDNDWTSTIDVVADPVVREDRMYAWFTFRADIAPKGYASFHYTTVDGTATAGEDYVRASGSITFLPGQQTRDLVVRINDDTQPEPAETFTLRLSHVVGARLARTSIPATITSEDVAPPPFRIAAPARNEGDSGTRTLKVTVTMLTASSSPVTVTVQTTGGGTATAGVDYQPFSHSLTFAPGVTEMSFDAIIIGDTLPEDDETFWVAVLQDGITRITERVRIRDDDSGQPFASIGDVEVRETDDASARATFAVTLSQPSTDWVRVAYETVPDTASLLDFTHTEGELLFQPGQTRQSISVPIAGDATRESTETFRVELLRAEAAKIEDATGVCTIVDDDGTGKRRAARH